MSFSIKYSNDEIVILAMYYKHLGEMSEEYFNLQNHAYWMFRRKNFNDSISELLNQTAYSLIQYIVSCCIRTYCMGNYGAKYLISGRYKFNLAIVRIKSVLATTKKSQSKAQYIV